MSDPRSRVGMETIAQDLCGVVSRNGARTTCRVLSRYSWYVSSQEPFEVTRCSHYSCMWSVENGMADQSSCAAWNRFNCELSLCNLVRLSARGTRRERSG